MLQPNAHNCGTYTTYNRHITYAIRDQFTNTISGFGMGLEESYNTPSGQCSSGVHVTTGFGEGDTILDDLWICHQSCTTGGSCSVSATQTIKVNGFTVATKSVTWTCSDVTVQ
ncbi:MAG: hypothetical protein L0387_17145 [Acidobacteria bacterium]|nr:hypothetical protein [Acidobacteriota bacterium]